MFSENESSTQASGTLWSSLILDQREKRVGEIIRLFGDNSKTYIKMNFSV